MHILITFDPRKAMSNVIKHGVDFAEAASCLFDPNALVQEDDSAVGERRWRMLDLSEKGRLLVVIYTLLDNDTVRLISARRATKTEVSFYA